MRVPTRLSPTGIKTFHKDKREFYLKYMVDERVPRMPQTEPMCVGSAFDARIKAYLSLKLFDEVREGYSYEELFEEQVEPANRDFARVAGERVYDAYMRTGAVADLLTSLQMASFEPRFESTVEDVVTIGGFQVPMLGKPDIYYVLEGDQHVIVDWKVNGYCGNSNTSPKPGFIMCYDTWPYGAYKQSASHMTSHKDCSLDSDGCNVARTLDQGNVEWADQMCIYAWILGEGIGAPFIVNIEQLAGPGIVGRAGVEEYPKIRVAVHRSRVQATYQLDLANRILQCWQASQSKEAFQLAAPDLNIDELDNLFKAYMVHEGEQQATVDWFASITRQHKGF